MSCNKAIKWVLEGAFLRLVLTMGVECIFSKDVKAANGEVNFQPLRPVRVCIRVCANAVTHSLRIIDPHILSYFTT